MTPARLVQAVTAEVKEAVKDYRMKAEEQEDKVVSVYAQHIPDEDFKDDSFYPLVIVSWQGSEDTDDGSKATIGLTFGVYGLDGSELQEEWAEAEEGRPGADGRGEGAWQDLLSIMERVRQRLLIFRLLDNNFRLILPTKFETIEAQPTPFWFGYGTLYYEIGQPNEQMESDWKEMLEEEA